MTIDIDAIRAREQAATEGPWEAGSEMARINIFQSSTTNHFVSAKGHRVANCGEVDAEFIARARTDVPALLARVDEQAAEIQRLRTVAEAVQKVIEVEHLGDATDEYWVARQGDAGIKLMEAMRALPAVAGQPHYHDPIECGCELTAADAPKATR